MIAFMSFTEGYGVRQLAGVRLPWVKPENLIEEWSGTYEYPDHTRAELSAINAYLGQPISPEDRAAGWTEASIAALKRYFEARREALDSGTLATDANLVTALEAWRIKDGSLFERIMAFNTGLPSPP